MEVCRPESSNDWKMGESMKRVVVGLCLFALLVCGRAGAADGNAPVRVSDFTPPVRVACLGDSITKGVGAEPGWAWPEQLDRMLGADWDARNFGHSGATVGKDDKNSIWNQKVLRDALAFHPDVLVLLLGTNDSKPENWAKKDDFARAYKELVVSFQQLSSHPRVFCGSPPYVAKKGNFGINDPVVLLEIPIIEAVAKELGAGMIDVHGATAGHDELFKDNVHPNTAGASLIARAVFRAITGKEWQGEIPGPSQVRKPKPQVREVENPGELTYRELFALIAAEAELPAAELAKLRERYEENAPVVAAKIQEMEDQIAEFDQLRMKYKHTPVEAEKPLYGEYKGKVARTKQELAAYKNARNSELAAAIPGANRAAFGAAWLRQYVNDRLAPVASTITPAQRKQITEHCQARGGAYSKINNTPERSIEAAEAFAEIYAKVLEAGQKRRIEPR